MNSLTRILSQSSFPLNYSPRAKRTADFDNSRDAKQLVHAVERLQLNPPITPIDAHSNHRLSFGGGSDLDIEWTRVPSKDFDDSEDSEFDEAFSGGSSTRRRTHSEPLNNMSSMDMEEVPAPLPTRVVQLRRDASRRLDEKIVSFATTKVLVKRMGRRRSSSGTAAAMTVALASQANGYAAGCECEEEGCMEQGHRHHMLIS